MTIPSSTRWTRPSLDTHTKYQIELLRTNGTVQQADFDSRLPIGLTLIGTPTQGIPTPFGCTSSSASTQRSTRYTHRGTCPHRTPSQSPTPPEPHDQDPTPHSTHHPTAGTTPVTRRDARRAARTPDRRPVGAVSFRTPSPDSEAPSHHAGSRAMITVRPAQDCVAVPAKCGTTDWRSGSA